MTATQQMERYLSLREQLLRLGMSVNIVKRSGSFWLSFVKSIGAISLIPVGSDFEEALDRFEYFLTGYALAVNAR